jgi:hypothetical protein
VPTPADTASIATGLVVIEHANGLHERLADRRADETKVTLAQVA